MTESRVSGLNGFARLLNGPNSGPVGRLSSPGGTSTTRSPPELGYFKRTARTTMAGRVFLPREHVAAQVALPCGRAQRHGLGERRVVMNERRTRCAFAQGTFPRRIRTRKAR